MPSATAQAEPPHGFAGLASDSRDVGPGYLFAALAGTRADGGHFISDAVGRGAIAILGVPGLRGEAERLGVRFISDANPRQRLAHLAAAHFGAQPRTIAAVTGTNGKTSVSVFLRQIWDYLGKSAASLGTVGLVSRNRSQALAHTTPDAISLHRLLAQLAQDGVTNLALEASSHGLDQYRLDGTRIAAASFTNITRDHLDYHPDFAHYLRAKLRLFGLVEPGGVAVVNADAPYAEEFLRIARKRKLRLASVGVSGESLRLLSRIPQGEGQAIEIVHAGMTARLVLPLVGDFQASNALVAAALAIGLGDGAERVLSALSTLKGAAGRLEKVAWSASGAPIYVDYAHTPDALETVLAALRPHVAGRLHLVFGCGGDRDRGKRPLMGEIAARLAERVIVTDDNPRGEDPTSIRRAILASCPDGVEIGDRAEAIAAAIAALAPDDALVIAGKGHEAGQIVGTTVRPFLDRGVAVAAALDQGGSAVPS